MRALSAALVLCIAFASPSRAQSDLGEVSFPNSGAAQAQEPFLRGLLLLHSFEYDDAREAFREAREIDPGFAMAAWGEAMTHNHPIWQRQDRDAARAALADVSREGLTARESGYLGTLDVLFGEGDKEARDDLYAYAVRQLAAEHPDDLDAKTFYSLALLGTAHEGRDFTTYMKAADVAEEVFDRNPRHPGAAHYLIHAYDDPVHAPLGLRPARVYAEIAPAASHALHMPSHIYIALGMWDETAEMNQRSYDAAKAGTDRRGQPLNGHGWHALWWWHYAATQLDDLALADSLLVLAVSHTTENSDDGTARAHLDRIGAQHALAFNQARALDDPAFGRADGLHSRAIRDLARASLALDAGDLDTARQLAGDLEAATAEEESWAVRSAALQLAGRVRLADGETEEGIALLREAAALETAAPLTFGPPSPVVPSNEALGWALLESGDLGAAAAAFQAALDRAPNRRQSVAGLEAARNAAR